MEDSEEKSNANQLRKAIHELLSSGKKKEEQRRRRLSGLEAINEQSELQALLREDYFVPLNSGTLPTIEYDVKKDDEGKKAIETWVYPAAKAFRTY